MARSSPSSDDDGHDYAQELQIFLADLAQSPDREQVASEIEVLQSIYGDDAIRVWHPPSSNGHSQSRGDATVRYEAVLAFPSPHAEISIKLLVSLSPAYPATSPPQLQLLSRYIGPFGIDSALFGSVLRTYISSMSGVEWSEDTVCVFDGLQNVLERCVKWYEDKLNEEKVGDIGRDDAKELAKSMSRSHSQPSVAADPPDAQIGGVDESDPTLSLPVGVNLYTAEPITDRKSAFVGRACRIHHPSEVPRVLAYLMGDRRIARAAHPIINAWRCQSEGVLHQDNDDDGETAAGGRLAHLLQILDVTNVLVVVTRYFGGIHLGPDRFKHINQSARNALDLGGFLEAADTRKSGARGKKH